MTKYPFDENVLRHKPNNKPEDLEQIVQKMDIKILELDKRLCSLENQINYFMNNHNKFYWDNVED